MACTPENVNRVREAFARSPWKSAKRHGIELGLSDGTSRTILKNDLHYHPFKVQVV